MDIQFGSFQVVSSRMIKIIEQLKLNLHKKIFIIVGENGTGRSTMAKYINQVVFGNTINIKRNEIDFNSQEAIVICDTEEFHNFNYHAQSDDIHVIEMPNLIDRKEDIVKFAEFFLQVLSLMNNQAQIKLTEKAAEKLLQYNWPGNFHELESALESAVQMALSDKSDDSNRLVIDPEHLTLNTQSERLEVSIGQKLDEVERKYILQTLYFVHQNRTKAAEILGISIRTLRNKINQYREEGYL